MCVEKALAGFRLGRAAVVIDPVDRTVVRLPRRVIRGLANWALRHLTGARAGRAALKRPSRLV